MSRRVKAQRGKERRRRKGKDGEQKNEQKVVEDGMMDSELKSQ